MQDVRDGALRLGHTVCTLDHVVFWYACLRLEDFSQILRGADNAKGSAV